MSHTPMRHVTNTNETRRTHERVTSHACMHRAKHIFAMCHLMKKSQTQHAVRSATAARKHLAHRTTSTTSSTTHGGKMMQRTGHMLQHLYACVCVHELSSRASASRDRDKKREESTARGWGNGCIDSQICRHVDTETHWHTDTQARRCTDTQNI